MRRTIAAAASGGLAAAALLGTGPAASAGTDDGRHSHDPVVVVDHLDNPRQLNWHGRAGDRLVIAEAGSGGESCFGEGQEQQCAGLTGAVSVVDRPARTSGSAPHRVLTGLLSVAGPDGSFAVGSNGADIARGPYRVLVAETEVPPAALPPGAEDLPGLDQLGHLLVAERRGPAVPRADLAAAEERLNPDGAQVESNPYAVLDVTDRHRGGRQTTLVADAAANAVWKVVAKEGGRKHGPTYEVSVFAAWPTTAGDETTPEFVPTSLAQDARGDVYIGGLGSEQPGRGAVEKRSASGRHLETWTGFTSVTGIAVDPDGSHLYVSQLFGTTPLLPPGDAPQDEAPPAGAEAGDVVRVDVEEGTYVTRPVPFPAGLAVDRDGRGYASAHSLSDADGSQGGPGASPGHVWRFPFPRHAEEAALPVTAAE